jgi:hypothetical protein
MTTLLLADTAHGLGLSGASAILPVLLMFVLLAMFGYSLRSRRI